MALPISSTPTYTVVVPSLEKEVKFRPFLVKDEKALLIAQQSEDPKVMVNTLRNVITNCVLDEVDTEKLATFDLEYLFTQIRAKSVGEIVELIFSCQQESCKDNDKAKVKVNIDITNIQVEKNPEHQTKIDLFDDVGVVMKYPTLDALTNVQKNQEGKSNEVLDSLFSVMADSISMIYKGDEVYHAKDSTKEELLQFVENLTSDQFAKLQKFFNTMPKLTKTVEYDCPVCKHHNVSKLEGLQSFF